MKLSLAWIFDHINADWEKEDLEKIVTLFNQITAEIEHVYPITHNLENFYVATTQTKTSKKALIHELSKEITLPDRNNEFDIIGSNQRDISYLVKQNKETGIFDWATLQDFNLDKQGLFPIIDVKENDRKGTWRKYFQKKDVILEVDNKSITHRPDMWCHRGFAREIAAFLNLDFIEKEVCFASYVKGSVERFFHKGIVIKKFNNKSEKTFSCPFIIDNQAKEICNKFTGFYIPSIENKPSNIFIASRLINIGSRPINGIVDLTNYVTFDWSQPVHAYDADKISDNKIIIRKANAKELLPLLDGITVELTEEDLVIADGKKPIGLAGIKGGSEDSITENTTSIFFESANFDSTSIRKTSLRQKIRTDSSSRFEKTLDKNQCEEAIFRFLSLCKQVGISFETAEEIISVGEDQKKIIVTVEHSFLEKHIGKTLLKKEIISLLEKLEFKVSTQNDNKNIIYEIIVPSFRASKDIGIKEDILEEVARAYGFENITLEVPKIQSRPFNLNPVRKKRAVQNHLAFAEKMSEQQNYSLYDEHFITTLGVSLPTIVSIKNPVSENYYRLIGSLLPGLLKNINENIVHKESIRFFELGRIWKQEQDKTNEIETIAGILFEKRKTIDFYDGKQVVINLLSTIGYNYNDISWNQIINDESIWYKQYQSAQLSYQNNIIGYAGVLNDLLLKKLDVLEESSAFIFELDCNFLFHQKTPEKKYTPFSRYQGTFFDLSLLTPLSIQLKTLQETLFNVDSQIKTVELIDFFEKEEWEDKRSITLRVWIENQDKTISKEELTRIWEKTIASAENLGTTIRSEK